MTIWLFRAGRSGEYENKFLNDERVYLTWDHLETDLRNFKEKQQLYNYLMSEYDVEKTNRARNWASQIWPIAHEMKIGDWVVLPSKIKSAVHIGEITGEYYYDEKRENPYNHFRKVKWFATDIPRSNFDQDILYSFGAFMTVCRIQRNDAEERIKAMRKNNWRTLNKYHKVKVDLKSNIAGDEESSIDLEVHAEDSIIKYITRKIKGNNLTTIVNAILKAKGFTTYQSPEGPDKGVDILASQGDLGFGSPKICVQVKSEEDPISRPILDQLVGTMHNFKADYGLLVSWSGFKNSVDREIPNQFFKVRLWDQKKVVEQLLENYDQLDEEIKSLIPLKRIWVMAEISD
ncbi:restriction endonuclease [Paenibacillus sp. SER-28]